MKKPRTENMSAEATFPSPGKRLLVVWTSSYGRPKYGLRAAVDHAFRRQHKYDKVVIRYHAGGIMDEARVEEILTYMRSMAPNPQVHLVIYGNF